MEEADKTEYYDKPDKKAGYKIFLWVLLGLLFFFMPTFVICILVVCGSFKWFWYGLKRKDPFHQMFGGIACLIILSFIPTLMIPVLKQHREYQQKNKCKDNLKRIYSYIEAYGNEHDGEFPEQLSDIDDDGFMGLLHCPADKYGEGISYVYIGGELEVKMPAKELIMYGREPWHSMISRFVLYGDGSVRAMTEDSFQEYLAEEGLKKRK